MAKSAAKTSKRKASGSASPIPKTSSRPKAKIEKAAKPARLTTPAGTERNSNFLADDELLSLIASHSKEATKHSKTAGEGSLLALRRYRDIGSALVEQKALGKFKKPNQSIKDWCNEHLRGVIGDEKPYAMAGLTMTLARPAKSGGPSLFECLMQHAGEKEKLGTPLGPLGINAALKIARGLTRGDAPAKPKAARADRLKAAAERLREFRDLVSDMLPAISTDKDRARFEQRLQELVPVEIDGAEKVVDA